jgi:hypothetical protein
MSLSQTPSQTSTGAPIGLAHIHSIGEVCPTCEQPIPRDRFEEIQERIQSRQATQEIQITARLQDQFKRETADVLEQARREAANTIAESVANARAEERQAAEAAANKKLADTERANNEAQAALQARIDQAIAATAAAQQSGSALRAELDQTRQDHDAAIHKVKQEAAADALKIREEAMRQAEATFADSIAEMQRTRQEAEAALRTRITEAEAAKAAAEQSGSTLRAELDQTRQDHEAAIEKLRKEAEVGAKEIREEAGKQAEATVAERIAEMERARQESEVNLQARLAESEVAKNDAQKSITELLTQIEQIRTNNEAVVEQTKQEAEGRVNAARHEATAAAEAAAHEKLAGAEQAKAEAEAKALAAEEQNRRLQEGHQAQLEERLQEQRDALERARTDAVNAEKQAAFERELKLQTKVDDLQRTLDHKTAEEQGEGAELNLLEALQAEFIEDKFEHVGRGNAGADIIHTVVHNGVECGKIIYDSKDHNQWRYDFATKLASDKIAANADHAILSVRKFPQGARQLHIHDGVILANPARVVVVVQVVRDHIVKSHTLRLSNEAKVQKSAELYAFITSAQFSDLLNRIDAQAQELQVLQDSERRSHENLWKKQSILFRSIQKAGADLSNRIDIIIGTAAYDDRVINDK